MNSWEVWECDVGFGAHPVVVVSHPARAQRKDIVEVLTCSTQRAARPALSNEVILDVEDGMNWRTFCRCDLIYAVGRDELKNKRGQVSVERQRQIVQTIIRSHGWTQF